MLLRVMGAPAVASPDFPRPEPVVPEIPGQLTGYWIEPGDDLPVTRPDYDPTGAVLRALVTNEDGTSDALSLVRVHDGLWRPVSHAAVRTYFHTAGLVDGEAWSFVVFGSDGRRHVFECSPPLSTAPLAEVESKFGREARTRAREDYPTVLFRIRQIDGERV